MSGCLRGILALVGVAALVLVLGRMGKIGFSPKRDPSDLAVASWNLEWFPGQKPEASPEEREEHVRRVQPAIKQMDPDILLLQEVRNWNAAQSAIAQVPQLRVHVVSAFAGQQQLAIASKLPAHSAWSERWTSSTADPPRGFAFAALQAPDNRFLLTYSVHLKSNIGNPIQNRQKREVCGRQLVSHVRRMEAMYSPRGKVSVIIGGDFNTDPADERFAGEQTMTGLIGAGFFWCFDGMHLSARATLPANDKFPDANFDHILFKNLEMTDVRVVKRYAMASDHRPVVATVGPPR